MTASCNVLHMQICKKCLLEKPWDAFYKNRTKSSGYGVWCKPCWDAYMADRKTPRTVAKAREQHLRLSYGLSQERYDALLAAQDGRCALCGEAETGIGKGGAALNLAVDHDWKCCKKRPTCGKCIRGLLCRRCNQILGRLNEDVDLLVRMVAYVQREPIP